MRVIEKHTVTVWRLQDDDQSGDQKHCCDGYVTEDYVTSSTEAGTPRDATAEEEKAFTGHQADEQEHIDRLTKEGVIQHGH